MGDHRPHIKIWMEFHGVTRQFETTCNWNFNSGSSNIANWIEDVIAEGMCVYNAKVEKYEYERKREAEEQKERLEYERLKRKFESPPFVSTPSAVKEIFDKGLQLNQDRDKV